MIARVLAAWLQRPSGRVDLARAIHDQSASWDAVVMQASRHHVLAAFAGAISPAAAAQLEPDLAGFLAAFLDANRARNRMLGQQVEEIASDLNAIGVTPVLLKGAVRLVDALYPDPGWRMMRDLDLLVPAASLADVVAALRARGYVEDTASDEAPPGPDYPHHHHPRLLRPDWPAPVELHTELFSARRHARLRKLLTASELVSASVPVALGGAAARLPCGEHQLIHLIGHCQIAHGGHACGSILLNDRFEAAALIRQSDRPMDLDRVLKRFTALGYRRPLLAFLLTLRDGDLCRASLPGRPDALTLLQERRSALVARSELMAQANVSLASLADSWRQQMARRRAAWSGTWSPHSLGRA